MRFKVVAVVMLMSMFFAIIEVPAQRSSGQVSDTRQNAPDPDQPPAQQTDGMNNPRIPEPMVFDLLRPLHARRGELEINTIFLRPLTGSNRELEWAPEIEYAFLDGYAVELEVPFGNRRLSAFKLGLQGTLDSGIENFAHGWQVVGKYNREDRGTVLDGLYMTGYRFNPRWSVFTMQGARRTADNGRIVWQGLFNPNLFYNLNDRMILGLETNLAFGQRDFRQQLIMPQAQLMINKHYSIQWGAGAARQGAGGFSPVLGWRLILTLNSGDH